MNFLTGLYQKTLAENEKNLRFWEDYLHNLKSLNFNAFADNLRIPVMVPIGSRVLFRGELKHTNEITVALGADYFAKCSVKQAEVLRQHRIKDAESKLEAFKKERQYIESQVSFRNDKIFEKEGQEIIEVYTEEEDEAWRQKHKENVRQSKKEKIEEDKTEDRITDDELWNRLEELELQEELEKELTKNESKSEEESFTNNKETIFSQEKSNHEATKLTEAYENRTLLPPVETKVAFIEPETSKVSGKFELLQKVIDKQNQLEDKLLELRNKQRPKSKNEKDLIDKLDEMEALEELEDEMERLEDIIDTEDVTSEEELEEDDTQCIPQSQQIDSKRRVSFADEDDSETLELAFHHSNVEPCVEPFDPKMGITKPSDVYKVFSNLFTETTSILKKSKYEDKNSEVELPKVEKKVQINKHVQFFEKEHNIENRTIVVKDIVEKGDVGENIMNGADNRPISLFKQRRQQKLSSKE